MAESPIPSVSNVVAAIIICSKSKQLPIVAKQSTVASTLQSFGFRKHAVYISITDALNSKRVIRSSTHYLQIT